MSDEQNAEKIIEITNTLLPLGLRCELCGCWLWISGDTKPHKNTIKDLGCRWSPNKSMWYWRPADHRVVYRRKGKERDMMEIRAKYGSTVLA